MRIDSVQQINFNRQVIPPKRGPKKWMECLFLLGVGGFAGAKLARRNKNARKQWSCSVERKY